MIYLIICNLFSDLEWKIIYVGSAESEEYDQTLDTVVVGPVIAGRHMFVFEVNIFTFLGRVSWFVFRSWFRDIKRLSVIRQIADKPTRDQLSCGLADLLKCLTDRKKFGLLQIVQ